MSTAAPFDVERLLSQVDGDRVLLGVLLEAFRQEWPRRALDATAAFDRQDADAARRALHALAGMLAQLGARAAPLVMSCERLVKAGDLAQAAQTWQQTTAELDALDSNVVDLLRLA